MNLVSEHIPVASRLADMWTPLTANDCLRLKAAGIDGVGRYLDNLTAPELQWIFAAGLKLFVIMHADDFDGARAVLRMQHLGLPAETMCVIDLESDHDPEVQVFQDVDRCAATINKASFLACLYVGCDQPLSGARLFALPNVTLYWRSASWVPEPDCGFAFYQLRGGANVMVAGVLVDLSMTELDKRGRAPRWVTQAA